MKAKFDQLHCFQTITTVFKFLASEKYQKKKKKRKYVLTYVIQKKIIITIESTSKTQTNTDVSVHQYFTQLIEK